MSHSTTLQNPSPQMFTVRDFVTAFRISRARLYQSWREGEGPQRVRVGRRVLIPAQAASAWVSSLLDGSVSNIAINNI